MHTCWLLKIAFKVIRPLYYVARIGTIIIIPFCKGIKSEGSVGEEENLTWERGKERRENERASHRKLH